MDLFQPGLAITYMELLQLSGHMISGSGVKIPIGIDAIGGCSSCVDRTSTSTLAVTSTMAITSTIALLVVVEALVEAFGAAPCAMAVFLADLALERATTPTFWA